MLLYSPSFPIFKEFERLFPIIEISFLAPLAFLEIPSKKLWKEFRGFSKNVKPFLTKSSPLTNSTNCLVVLEKHSPILPNMSLMILTASLKRLADETVLYNSVAHFINPGKEF